MQCPNCFGYSKLVDYAYYRAIDNSDINKILDISCPKCQWQPSGKIKNQILACVVVVLLLKDLKKGARRAIK